MSAKAIVCRVSMIPGGDAVSRKAELLDSIQGSMEKTELQHLNAIKISIVRSCYDPQMFTALVQFMFKRVAQIPHDQAAERGPT